MDAYTVVLYLHLMSLFVGLGAGTVLAVCLFQLRAARTVEQAVPFGVIAGKAGMFFPVAILGLFGSGAYLVTDQWSWSTRWIDVGIAALVVLTIQGVGVAERTAKKLEAALHANGPGSLGTEARRMTLHPGLWVVEFSNLGLVFGIVWNMTQKPGLGGAIAAALGGYAVGAVLALLLTRARQEELTAAPETAG
ncbi:MAG TPA: hypothetical protein VKR79_05265 [Gaiellaceae bacterium]|nr:hypothetical protein [Gaiellaceae bacterium]